MAEPSRALQSSPATSKALDRAELPVVEVYVRLCTDSNDPCREMSFRIPEGINQRELLEESWAIDGNSALRSVSAYYDEHEHKAVPLGEALCDAQFDLINWFEKRGYSVVFK